MFSSLHKVDIAIEGATGPIAVQTDHRDAAEIESTYDLSVVFALTRAINPIRSGNFEGVRFALLNEAPERFVSLLRAAGAEVEPMGGEILEAAPDPSLIDVLSAEALSSLGQRVLSDLGAACTVEGMVTVERAYAARVASTGGRDEDEIGYWTALVELGAATGEILRALHGGAWSRDPEFFSMVPFMLERDGMKSNVFGKAERFLERGPSESPTQLLRSAQDHGLELGPVMFNLRPRGWAGQTLALCEPLLSAADKLGDHDLPWVALVHDLPHTTRTLSHETDPAEIEGLKEQALASLRQIEVEIAPVTVEALEFLVVHGDYYASEKLLDPVFMLGLQERLGAQMLMAGVPIKGQLYVTSAPISPEQTVLFSVILEQQRAEAPPNEQLSSALILLTDGAPSGVVRLAPPGEGEASDPGRPVEKGRPSSEEAPLNPRIDRR